MGEIQPGEFAKMLDGSFVISAGGILGSIEPAKVFILSINFYLCPPLALMPAYALKAAGVIGIWPSIPFILRAGRPSQIARLVIEAVPVFVVAFLSCLPRMSF